MAVTADDARILRSQKGNSVGNFIRCADALWDVGLRKVRLRFLAAPQTVLKWRIDDAWVIAFSRDTLGEIFQGGGPREAHHRVLACNISSAVLEADEGVPRSVVHDDAVPCFSYCRRATNIVASLIYGGTTGLEPATSTVIEVGDCIALLFDLPAQSSSGLCDCNWHKTSPALHSGSFTVSRSTEGVLTPAMMLTDASKA